MTPYGDAPESTGQRLANCGAALPQCDNLVSSSTRSKVTTSLTSGKLMIQAPDHRGEDRTSETMENGLKKSNVENAEVAGVWRIQFELLPPKHFSNIASNRWFVDKSYSRPLPISNFMTPSRDHRCLF
jgi:hypothetical protein